MQISIKILTSLLFVAFLVNTAIGKPSEIKKSIVNIDVQMNYLLGEYADRITEIDDSFWAKTIYGYRLSYQRFIVNNIALGFHYSNLKNSLSYVSGYDPYTLVTYTTEVSSHLTSYSGSLAYYLNPSISKTPYIDFEYGKIKGKTDDLEQFDIYDLESDYAKYYKLGIGYHTVSKNSIIVKVEIFYKTIQSESLNIMELVYPPIEGNMSLIGLAFGLGYNFDL